MKVIIWDIGHSEWIKKDNPLETEIAKLFCRELQNNIFDDIRKGENSELVSVIVPENVTGLNSDDALMNKIHFANAIAKKDACPKVYVSVHCNWSNDNPNARGWSIFYKDLAKARNTELAYNGKRLADILGGRLQSAGFQPIGAGVEPDSHSGPGSLAVCTYTSVPACLIELGFLSNVDDKAALQDSIIRSKMEKAVWSGLQAYFL